MMNGSQTETANPETYTKTKGDNPLLHVVKSTGYSLEGLFASLKHEMAFRIEFTLAIVLIPLAMFLPVDWILRGILVSMVLLVLIVELLNSSVEWAIDYISLDKHPFAKRAKDMGSAAVFFSLVNCGMWWLVAVLIWQGVIQ